MYAFFLPLRRNDTKLTFKWIKFWPRTVDVQQDEEKISMRQCE